MSLSSGRSRLSAASVVGVLAMLLLAGGSAGADDWTPMHAFRTFSKATYRGLPQSSVISLAQDAEGVLWIGTLDGAATFDGRTLAPVPDVPGAPLRGLIGVIAPRRSGGVFVASPAGVHVFDGHAWRLLPTKRGPADVLEAKDGTLFMADSDGALFSLGAHGEWTAHAELKEPALLLASDPGGGVWVATPTGAVLLTGMHGGAPATKQEPIAGAPLPGRPGAMLMAHDRRIWIATLSGTVHWARAGEEGWHQAPFASWARGAFRCLTEDRRGRVWAGSYGGGVAFGNAESAWTVWNAANGPFEAGVMSVLCDREGSLWFGLNAVGLAQWVGEEWSHRTVLDANRTTRQLFSGFGLARGAEPKTLLVAAFNSGALRLSDGPPKSYGAADGLTEDVRAIVEPSPGRFFAGTRFGIFEAEPGQPFRRVAKIESGFAMGLFAGADGRWYAATSTQGVLVRENGAWTPAERINAALENKHVRSLLWRKNGDLWVATLRGITVFREGAEPERLRDKSIPESVNALLESDDELWAGGTGGIGILRAGAWRRLTEKDGLPGQTVYSLGRTPDGAVWIGGSAGVGRIHDGKTTVWDSRAGLLGEECNLNGLLVGDDGSVYVGTMGGLARFDPKVAPLVPPPLRLAWRLAPEPGPDGSARLPRGDRALHLKWAAPWLGPKPVQYRVRVPRLREAWSPASSDDHIDVENLGPGAWRVEVEARVEGTDDWTAPLALDLVVPAYWHETLLARAGFALLLLGAAYAAVRLRLAALHRRAERLEGVVAERTAQLAEKVELLSDSEQRALAASRAKSAFLANMSHELRTPLNGILGFAQLLSRRPGRDAEDKEGLGVILRSGEHLLGLINDVLSLSKIEAGRVTLDEAPFDLAQMVRDVEDVLRLRAEAKDLTLGCEVDGLPRAVRGDEGRLRQVLINLVGNAVKFTERGGVTLRASWKDGRGRFEVADSGPGIAPAEQARLFEPFVQTETGRRSREGTGLGLALSRDLARLMGGDITFESELGRGTTFRVDVRLPEAPAEALAAARDRRRVVGLTPGQEDVRVLVVDDVAVNRTVLSRLLASVGFQVKEAASGEEAVEAVRAWRPRVVFMDKRMPGIDGLEATRRIRAAERDAKAPRVPIIAVSASALEHERSEIFEAGCDDFIAKPFRDAVIFAKIREHAGVAYVYEAGERRRPPRGETRIPAFTSGRVLLVDDDWVCRELAQELLQDAGLGVTLASGGADALSALEKERFDAVLMDVQMPGMDGPEVARRIKANGALASTPVIAMTAESFDDDRALADAGMDDYVAKPIEKTALVEVLARWIPPREQTGASPRIEPG